MVFGYILSIAIILYKPVNELNHLCIMAEISHALEFDLNQTNAELEAMNSEQRVAWAFENVPGPIVMTSSFGAQAAVCLHLVTRQQPDIPVILIDTGYLFEETYRFVDDLSKRLSLNLKVYRAEHTPSWQEARYGRLWEQGLEGLQRYNYINKVEPMQRALEDLQVETG